MRVAVLAAMLLAFLPGAPAFADDDIVMLRYEQDRAGLPQRFVPPDYPKEAVDHRITGYVDVEGVVDGNRRLSDPAFRPGTPEAEVFVPALREVAKDWAFFPAFPEHGCVPVATRMGLRVIFELENGKPKISIETPKVPPKRVTPVRPQCNKPSYPRDALRNEETGIVYTTVNVKPNGTVASVDTDVYPRHGAFIDDQFSESVKSAMSTCKFGWTHDQRPRAACFEIGFNIRDPLH